MSDYDDLSDTWIDFPPPPSAVPVTSFQGCGCALPTSCRICDGTRAEGDERWRLPRDLRTRLDLANRRLDPAWRALHGPDEGQEAAQAALDAVTAETERVLSRRDAGRRVA